MGALAKWGAIAGAAGGYAKGKEAEWAAEAETQKSDDEWRRKQAFERLQQKNRMELEATKQAGATERTGIGAETSVEVAQIGAGSRQEVTGMQIEDRQSERLWRSGENALDRENAKEIAAMREANKTGGATSKMLEKQLGRFQARTLTQEEANQYGIALSKSEEPAVFDEMSGTWYVQQNDKLFLAGDTERKPKARPNNKHIEALYNDPYMSEMFYDKFGYLPKGYLQALMTFDLKNMARQPAAAPEGGQ